MTVRNPGPGTRYFWLSPGRVRERLGAGGGRLSSAIALTVMELTDISSPTVIYRGPLRYVGARPLGFLEPGARRSFSFVAELPGRRALAGRPVGRSLPRRRRHHRLDLALACRHARPAQPPTPIRREAGRQPAHARLLGAPPPAGCWRAGRWG